MERAKHLAVIILCAVLAVCAITLTHHVNATLIASASVATTAEHDEHMLAIKAASQMDNLAPQVAQVLRKVSGVADNTSGLLRASQSAVATTSAHLNAPCDPAPCGTLSDINRTLATARGTLGQGELAAIAFNRHSSEFYDQESAAATDVQTAASDLHRFMSAPDIYAALHNVNTASLTVAHTAQNVDAVTADGRAWVHAKLYPTKRKGFVSGFEATGDAFHHWFPPLF